MTDVCLSLERISIVDEALISLKEKVFRPRQRLEDFIYFIHHHFLIQLINKLLLIFRTLFLKVFNQSSSQIGVCYVS